MLAGDLPNKQQFLQWESFFKSLRQSWKCCFELKKKKKASHLGKYKKISEHLKSTGDKLFIEHSWRIKFWLVWSLKSLSVHPYYFSKYFIFLFRHWKYSQYNWCAEDSVYCQCHVILWPWTNSVVWSINQWAQFLDLVDLSSMQDITGVGCEEVVFEANLLAHSFWIQRGHSRI